MAEHLAAHPDATAITQTPRGPAPVSTGPSRTETAEPWMEVREGQPEPVAAGAATGERAASAGGLRFAEDLKPALTQPAKKAKKGGKKERGSGVKEEEGAAKGGKAPKRKQQRFTVIDEDEDFGAMLEEYGEESWKDEEEKVDEE